MSLPMTAIVLIPMLLLLCWLLGMLIGKGLGRLVCHLEARRLRRELIERVQDSSAMELIKRFYDTPRTIRIRP